MKTSEEMARSVINRAQAHRATVRRRVFTAASAALFACILTVSAVTFKTPTTNDNNNNVNPVPATKINIRPAKIGLVRYGEENQAPVELKQGIQTPYAMEVRVHDIRNKTEEEVSAILESDKQYAKELVETHVNPGEAWQWDIFDNKNVIVTTICAGHFFIEIEDYKQVDNIRITLQGTGMLGQVGQLDSEEFFQNAKPKEYYMDYWRVAIDSYQNGGVGFIWMLSSETMQALGADPTIPLSTCCDSIKVVVNMKDGSQQVGFIDIQLDDEGNAYTTYHGDTKTA